MGDSPAAMGGKHGPGAFARRHRPETLGIAMVVALVAVWMSSHAGAAAPAAESRRHDPSHHHPQTQPAQGQDGKGSDERQGHPHDHDARASHSFDDVERWVKVFESPERAAWQKPEQIPAALGLKPGMVVADIGAGTGYFVPHFSKAVGPGGKVLAVDIEPGLVAYMSRRFADEKLDNAAAMLAAPDDPKLPDGGVDRIFICNTWHHINDRLEYLRRLSRALKPGGLVTLVDFHKRELPVGPPPEHKMTREEVVAEFAEAGWRLAGESDLLPHQYLLLFAPPQP